MDRSPHFTRFGAQAADALDKWQQINQRPLSALKWLDTGGSGALLASVFIRDSDPQHTNRRMIIKLCSPDGGASMEPGRLISARRSVPNGDDSFPRDHLVEQLYDPIEAGGSWLMFQGFAGNDATMVTLSTILRQRRLPGVAAEITRSLLADWNPDERTHGEMTAAAFVAELLDRRLEPDEPLPVWVRDELGLDLATPWIRTGRPGAAPVPNPVHVHDGCPLSEHTVAYPMRGRAHGDLHPGNVMVPRSPEANVDEYVLIDLSRFDEGALLARDPAHLLLCLVADFLPHLSEDARADVLDLLVGRDTPGLLIPQGLARTVDRVRAAPESWLRMRTVSSEWHGQWLLSLQACALMFTARARYDARDRWWFFRLAAEAGGEYLRSVDAYEPGESVFVAGPREAPPALETVVAAAMATAPTAWGRVPSQMTAPPDPTPAHAPASDEPVASGPRTEGPLPALLVALRETFGGHLEAVRQQTTGTLTAEILAPVAWAAAQGRKDLAALVGSVPSPVSQETRGLLDAVLGQLSRVTEAVIEPKLREEQPVFQRDLAHRSLAMTLSQLLETLNEALLNGEFGQATDPSRPDGAAASG
ncbi:hypothetical protein EOT10_01745 [Streptomyces antnestii]|uniref:Uncharacterized protein n=1 Tax=Streptomyces antnestii TaxID=2494256 RepID=A0A437Q275_9ACTN|nr:hypothetical protein [Streptomyces sp. San01]RVU28628.1 hypothetical protein EOT10_01745 [Streptomyces sp. San01]